MGCGASAPLKFAAETTFTRLNLRRALEGEVREKRVNKFAAPTAKDLVGIFIERTADESDAIETLIEIHIRGGERNDRSKLSAKITAPGEDFQLKFVESKQTIVGPSLEITRKAVIDVSWAMMASVWSVSGAREDDAYSVVTVINQKSHTLAFQGQVDVEGEIPASTQGLFATLAWGIGTIYDDGRSTGYRLSVAPDIFTLPVLQRTALLSIVAHPFFSSGTAAMSRSLYNAQM